jgi:hypothetical protein
MANILRTALSLDSSSQRGFADTNAWDSNRPTSFPSKLRYSHIRKRVSLLGMKLSEMLSPRRNFGGGGTPFRRLEKGKTRMFASAAEAPIWSEVKRMLVEGQTFLTTFGRERLANLVGWRQCRPVASCLGMRIGAKHSLST